MILAGTSLRGPISLVMMELKAGNFMEGLGRCPVMT